MAEPTNEASQHFQRAVELKARGQMDAALTEYRRAALADAGLVAAHFEIGLLCKEKAKRDPLFSRYAFEAFRQAARLDLTHKEAHNQYIMAAQKMGLMEDLLQQYDDWLKKNPESELMQQCKKNIIALSMAMMPQAVNVGGSKASGAIRKFVVAGSIATILLGLALVFGPPLLSRRAAKPLAKQHMSRLMVLGLFLDAAGIGGLLLFTRLK